MDIANATPEIGTTPLDDLTIRYLRVGLEVLSRDDEFSAVWDIMRRKKTKNTTVQQEQIYGIHYMVIRSADSDLLERWQNLLVGELKSGWDIKLWTWLMKANQVRLGEALDIPSDDMHDEDDEQ